MQRALATALMKNNNRSVLQRKDHESVMLPKDGETMRQAKPTDIA